MTRKKGGSIDPADPIYQVNSLEDHLGRSLTFTGSNSLADLNYDLHADAEAVVIFNTSGATLYYTPNGGTAGTGNLPLADGKEIRIAGNRAKLALVRLYLAAEGTIGILQEIGLQETPATTTTTTT